MGWTDERVALLKKLWMEGHSAAQIAKQLGGGVTRNAVIGKVHRLGLAGRATPSRPAKRPAARQQARPRIATASTTAVTAPRPRLAVNPPMLSIVPPLEPLRREDGSVTTVLTLSDRVCKWPIGDPGTNEFAFCGRGSCEGPYCAEHARLAFQPQQSKKKRTFGEPDQLRRALRMVANG